MNPKFLTNLTSVLLACNTSFDGDPPFGVSMMRFTLKDGMVQKHEVNGGKEVISPINVTFCNKKPNELNGIRLQPFENTGNLWIGGEVEKDSIVCPVYGQADLMPINAAVSAMADTTNFFIFAGKVYENRCPEGKSTQLSFRDLSGSGGGNIYDSVFPCTQFGINHQDRVIVFEKDGKCKRIDSEALETVKDCYQSKILKPSGMYETEFYSLRYLTIMYPKCYTNLNFLENGTELDNIHVKYLFKQPTTVVIPTTTALPKKDEYPTVLLVIAGVVAALLLVGLVVGLFIWKRPCCKKEKPPIKEKEDRALEVVKPVPPKEKEKVEEKEKEKKKEEPEKKKAKSKPKAEKVMARIQPGNPHDAIKVDPADDGLSDAPIEKFEGVDKGLTPNTITRIYPDMKLELDMKGKEEVCFSGIRRQYRLLKGVGNLGELYTVKLYPRDRLDLAKIEVTLLKKLNETVEEHDRHHETIFYWSYLQNSRPKTHAIILTDYWPLTLSPVTNMNVERALILGYQCLLGLRQLHNIGYAHLNICPENFRHKDGRVIVVEVGVARRFNTRRHHRREHEFFASIGSHDDLPVSMLDDYQSWLLLVLNFTAKLPFSRYTVTKQEERDNMWFALRKEKQEVVMKLKNNATYSKVRNIKVMEEVRDLFWSQPAETTVDYQRIVKHMAMFVEDQHLNLYTDSWDGRPAKKSIVELKKDGGPNVEGPPKGGKISLIKTLSKTSRDEPTG